MYESLSYIRCIVISGLRCKGPMMDSHMLAKIDVERLMQCLLVSVCKIDYSRLWHLQRYTYDTPHMMNARVMVKRGARWTQ